jgi:hypothetical protein
MLYHWLYPLAETIPGLNVVRYITFRTAAATLTALFISFIVGPWLIRRLAALRVGQPIREIGPAHAAKAGTPTMGGLLILLSLVISVLLWTDLSNPFVWIVLGPDGGLRRARLHRRLREGHQEDERGHLGARQALLAGPARLRRRDRHLHEPRLRRRARGALLQGLHARTSAGSTSRSRPSSSSRRRTA